MSTGGRPEIQLTARASAGELRRDRAMIVRLHLNRRGRWSVDLSDAGGEVACETLDDARRLAYLCAARRQPCELVIQDAYHRVVQHEFIEGFGSGHP